RRARNLLKLLALRPGYQIHKDQAIDLLWPDLDATAARDNLYRTLYNLRHTLEPELIRAADSRFITLSEEVLRLGPAGAVWVDADAFESLVAQAHAAADPVPLLEAAVQLYRGDLLETDPYDDWMLARRDTLQRTLAEALTSLAVYYRERGDCDAA